MISAEQVKEKLTTEDIIKIVCNDFGSPEPIYDREDNPIFNTCVCHGGDSYKLWYYKESKTFYCYSHCGPIGDIFNLTQHVKHFDTFQEAFKYVIAYFHIDTGTGFNTHQELISDWDILQQVDDYDKYNDKPSEEQKIINENILEYFDPISAPKEWQADYITPEIMRYFGIRVDGALSKIIIPHRNIDGRLLGIRGRTYNPIELLKKQKYMPVFVEGIMYNHKLGSNLYGLYENKETITRLKKVLVCESEKSVLQCGSYFGPANNFAVAVCGSTFSQEQLQLLLSLGVEEIIFGFDHDVELKSGTPETEEWENKIYKQIEKALPYVNVYVIGDYDNITPLKASPTDCGKDILITLMKKKIYIPSVHTKSVNKIRKKSI